MRKFIQSFKYALNGILNALRTERNFRIQFATALIVILAGLYFDISVTEWCLILFAIGLVLGLELMNSAIENLVDLVTQEHKPLAGKIKDFAAAAVLVVSIVSAVLGTVIFWKYIVA